MSGNDRLKDSENQYNELGFWLFFPQVTVFWERALVSECVGELVVI